jgi:pimeloyl-ACP methyl ester carboxylesterase
VLILLHPLGLDRHCWGLTALDTAGALDLPGHGDRIGVPVPSSVEAFADDIASQVSGSFDVVGVSVGGMVAQHLALRYPARIRSAVLACTTDRADARVALERAAAVEEGAMAGVLDSSLMRWFSTDALERLGDQGVAYARERLLTDDPAAIAATWRAIAGHDVASRLSAIRQPVTVLAGSADVSSPPVRMAQLQQRLPNSRFEVVRGPHMLMLENPAEFTRAILSHLEWVAGRGT